MAEYAELVRETAYDSWSSMFQPDVMLPSQFLEVEDGGIGGGERRLMAALLSDGVEAYIAQCVRTKGVLEKEQSDAVDWVDTKDSAYVFSFDNVCNCLGIDPEYLRLGLQRYVETIVTRRREGRALGTVWKKIRRPRK